MFDPYGAKQSDKENPPRRLASGRVDGLLTSYQNKPQLSPVPGEGFTPPLPLPGPPARSIVGGPEIPLPPKRVQNARDIPHCSHLAAILLHLIAHLVHLKPTYAPHVHLLLFLAHLSSS